MLNYCAVLDFIIVLCLDFHYCAMLRANYCAVLEIRYFAVLGVNFYSMPGVNYYAVLEVIACPDIYWVLLLTLARGYCWPRHLLGVIIVGPKGAYFTPTFSLVYLHFCLYKEGKVAHYKPTLVIPTFGYTALCCQHQHRISTEPPKNCLEPPLDLVL